MLYWALIGSPLVSIGVSFRKTNFGFRQFCVFTEREFDTWSDVSEKKKKIIFPRETNVDPEASAESFGRWWRFMFELTVS